MIAKILRQFGPAIIVAAVVLGPGSILTSSKVGCEYGSGMLWVLLSAGVLMLTSTALSARIGVSLPHSPCTEVAHRLGRPIAVFVGVTIFVIVAGFQSSNNLAVLAAIEPLIPATNGGDATSSAAWIIPAGILFVTNAIVVAAMLGFKKLYQPLEKGMIVLVAIMILGFAANLVFALFADKPDSVPVTQTSIAGFWPRKVDGKVVDPLGALPGLVATTFSIAGAFYQAYMVREKGWTRDDLGKGLNDSIFGICMLVGTSAMIMLTAATVLYGYVSPSELTSAGAVAAQLEPLFGSFATVLFSLGIFSGAFSSFLVNAMIGGVLLSDGLGLGASIDQKWPRVLTVVALAFGMLAAIISKAFFGGDLVGLIVFAQAFTVIGGPVLAILLLYFALSPSTKREVKAPAWVILLSMLGLVVLTVLAARVAVSLYYRIPALFLQ